jgi:uncharacterized protein with von Willebrand factor type A (vWA) domain
MDKRTVEFIRALRAAGVRISLAETQDALNAVDLVGIQDRSEFRSTLLATLVKEHKDSPVFDYFFPLFFENNAPPMWDVTQELTPDQQDMLQQALQSMMGDMDALRDMLEQLLQGQQLSQDQLDQLAEQAGMQNAMEMYQQRYYSRQMQRQMGMQELRDLIEQLLEQLAEMGMSQEALDELRGMLEENMDALREQINDFAGAQIAQQMAERERPPRRNVEDLHFQHLTKEDADAVRDEMRRLAARLRSRASLRQKRAKTGQLDPKKTIRANLKYGGVPLELRHRHRHVKPKLAVICDLSGSMRHMSEFILTLTYMLQDLVAKTRSFVFIEDMVEVTHHFNALQPRQAVEKVLIENPRGYYTTDLGNSLMTFTNHNMDAVDTRTTLILVGDGRNNFLNPRLELAEQLERRARRLIWFCPEPEHLWGTGDSDMHLYAPVASNVFLVRNLRELGEAIDNILVDG